MFILRLAWRNLWRYPKRTFLTALALFVTTFAMVFLLNFQIGAYDSMKEQTLKLMDGYGQFQAPDYLAQPSIRHRFELAPSLIEKLESLKSQIPGLIWTPQAEAFGLAMHQTKTEAVQILGIDPLRNALVSTLTKTLIDGRTLVNGDQKTTLLGRRLASHLGVTAGDDIQILSQDVHGSVVAENLHVVGIFDTGLQPLNSTLMVIPLPMFQTLYVMPNQAHRILVMSHRLTQIESKASDFKQLAEQNRLVFRDWAALEPGLENAIEIDFYSGMIWYVAILIIVALIVFNTILMSILEREKEFGLMLSLGMSSKQLSGLVIFETGFTMILGMSLGMIAGLAVSLYYRQVGITLPGTEEVYQQFGLSPTLFPAIDPFGILFSPLFLLGSGVIMSFYLTYKLHRLSPISGRNLAS